MFVNAGQVVSIRLVKNVCRAGLDRRDLKNLYAPTVIHWGLMLLSVFKTIWDMSVISRMQF